MPYKRYLTKHVKSCPDCTSKAKPTHLIGKKFNNLTVIAFDHYNDSRKDYWLCRCDCGKETIVQGYNLKSGAVKSCGCKHYEDLHGYKDNNIEVVSLIFKGHDRLQPIYECKCLHCGSIFIAGYNDIKNGKYHSCGCVNSDYKVVADFLKLVTRLEIQHLPDMDIYIPSLRIGMDFINSASAYGTYRREKFLSAKDKGIHLLSIFDIDWNDKVKSYLSDLVKPPVKRYARQCEIRKISSSEANSFCDEYHLQGSTRANSICYGLFYNNYLYSVMTLGHIRYKPNGSEYELYRYCVRSGYTIIGGASKLFKHFLLDYNPSKVVSYSDNDYFSGDIYPKLGFKYDGQCALPYFWFGTDIRKREQCQAHKLKEMYPEIYQKAIDEGASNKENFIMTSLGYKKVFRSGNTRWIYENQDC